MLSGAGPEKGQAVLESASRIDDQGNATSAWVKSSYCSSGGCVEVALAGDLVLVRDSKNVASPQLEYRRDEWAAFVAGVKHGEFDLQE